YKQDKLEEAAECYQKALRLKPDSSAAHSNLGLVLLMQGKAEEAIIHFQNALRLQPDHTDAHWNRSLALLLMGNFDQGWLEYEWRWKKKEFALPSFPHPRWDGSALAGKTILLH